MKTYNDWILSKTLNENNSWLDNDDIYSVKNTVYDKTASFHVGSGGEIKNQNNGAILYFKKSPFDSNILLLPATYPDKDGGEIVQRWNHYKYDSINNTVQYVGGNLYFDDEIQDIKNSETVALDRPIMISRK